MKNQVVNNKKKQKTSVVDSVKIKSIEKKKTVDKKSVSSNEKEKIVIKGEKSIDNVDELPKKQNKKSDSKLNMKPVKVEDVKINFKIKKEIEKPKKQEKNLKLEQIKRKNEAVPEVNIKKLKKSEEKVAPVSKKLIKSTNEAKPVPKDAKLKVKAQQSIKADKKSKVSADQGKKHVGEVKKEVSKKTKQSKKDKKCKKVTEGVKIEVDGEEKVVNDLELDEQHVLQAVDGILQLAEQEKNNKALFSSDDNPVFLQVNCIKIPKTPHRRMRIFLPHDMVGPTDDVALFVGDLEKGRRKDYEKTIEHWENVLQEKGVSRIKEIIPMAKVKAEYRQFEMKRKLSKLFDFYLVDGRIAGHMSHLLGSTFTRGAIPPTPIRIQRDNLKGEIDAALKKTCMEIHGNGGTHCVRIGTVAMPKEKIAENVLAACKALEKDYPGGFDNIRSLTIKTRKSLAIPVYYSMKDKNDVAVPVVQPKRPKAYKTVTGELSTLDSEDEEDVQVAVTPRGDVKILRKKSTESDEQTEPVKNKNKKIKNNSTFKTKAKPGQKKVLDKKQSKKVQ